jgi:hypothetical protein
MFPNFLCIGAEKSGTSWLYYNLKKHPQIWMPPVKEIHYLDEIQRHPSLTILDRLFDSHFYNRNWRQILKEQIKSNLRHPNLENILWYGKYLFNPRNDEWYASIFDTANDKVTGDITPEYSSFKTEEVAYVYRIMPKSKIIFLMRDPIDRAWSHALMYERKKGEKFSEAEFIEHFNSKHSRIKGNYLRTIKNWQSYYPKKQFFIGYFEEIQQCPENFLIRLSKFLEVELPKNSINPKTIRKKINSSRTKQEIPLNFAVHLARLYHDELESLDEQFGGEYTSNWLDYAKELLS